MTGHSGQAGWWAVANLAAQQHSVVSRDQLRGLGLSDAKIDWALGSGHLHRVFRGAFGLGHPNVGSNGHMLAAVLACGAGSVVSHGTAAFLLGLWDRQPALVDVIAPVQAGRKIPGIRRRHTPPPRPFDIWLHHAVPCTSPSRTIVDVAGIVGEAPLRRTIEQAAVRGLLDVPRIDQILDGPRRRGSRCLRRTLESWRHYKRGTVLRSVLEARLLSMLSMRGIPLPECNAELRIGHETFEVDFLWRRQRLVVETDGQRYHANPEAEARDANRDRSLFAACYRVWRLRWDDLEKRPEATMKALTHRLRSAVPSPAIAGQRNSGAE